MPAITHATTQDIEEFLSDLADLPDDLSRRVHLVKHWPDVPENFWRRLTPTQIIRMDADQFMRVITYADPTGETAVGFRRQP